MRVFAFGGKKEKINSKNPRENSPDVVGLSTIYLFHLLIFLRKIVDVGDGDDDRKTYVERDSQITAVMQQRRNQGNRTST